MSYWRFGAMILTSTVVMYGLMYLNTYVWAHVFWSETRVYMALLMGATMAVIMLSFMWSMYARLWVNLAIYGGSLAIFALALWLVRSQATVGEVAYMRAMIPHHSIAILTSNRAQIEDPRVRKLADEIIAAQQKEISEMRYLIAVLEGEIDVGIPQEYSNPEAPATIATVEEALERPVLATLDAEDLTAEEIDRVLGSRAYCRFLRTEESDPILAVTEARGVLKLSGQLIVLEAVEAGPLAARLRAEGLRLAVVARPEAGEAPPLADFRMELAAGLTAGYRGTWDCG